MDLKDKVVVIIGASDGIGKQIALKLANKQVSLALVGRDQKRLEDVLREAVKLGAVGVKTYSCDIRNTKLLTETVQKIINDFKKVDILLNVAGIWQKIGSLENIEESVVNDVIQTNLIGLIHCTRLFLPYLKKQNEAAIINISSRSGVTAQEGQSVYTASKWGVTGFTEVLKEDLKSSGVRVAGIYQGGTNTKMFNKAGDIKSDEKLNSFIPPENLADVIVFMLSLPKQIWLHDVRVEY